MNWPTHSFDDEQVYPDFHDDFNIFPIDTPEIACFYLFQYYGCYAVPYSTYSHFILNFFSSSSQVGMDAR